MVNNDTIPHTCKVLAREIMGYDASIVLLPVSLSFTCYISGISHAFLVSSAILEVASVLDAAWDGRRTFIYLSIC